MITAVALPFLTRVEMQKPREETNRTSTISCRTILMTGKLIRA